MRFARLVAATASTNVAIAAITFVTSVLASRMLGPEGRGELAAIQSWPSAIGSIAMVGLPEAVTYYCAKEASLARRLIALGMLVALAASIAGIGIGVLVLPTLLSGYSVETVSTAQIYLAIALVYITGIPLSALRSTGHFNMWNVLRVLPNIGWLAILLFFALRPAVHASLLALSFLAVVSVIGVGFTAVAFRTVEGHGRPGPRAGQDLVSYGLKTWIASAPQTLNLRADHLTLLVIADAASVGMYTVALAWGNASGMLLSAIGATAFPQIAAQRGPRAAAGLGKISRASVLVATVVALMLAALAPIAVPILFGEDFRGASIIAGLLVFSSTISALASVLEESLRGLGRPGYASLAHLLGGAATAGLVVVLAGELGLIGAWLAAMIGAMLTFFCIVALVVRTTGVSIRHLVLPTREDFEALVRAVRGIAQR